jgi:hypothetical protein
MLRTAHDWYMKMTSYANYSEMNGIERIFFEKIINEIRKEAIEECAKNARRNRDWSEWKNESDSVDKHSILKLIDELK